MRAHAARRLVEDNEDPLGELQRRAVQLNRGWLGLAARIVLHPTGDRHPSVDDKPADLAARAVAEASEYLIDPAKRLH